MKKVIGVMGASSATEQDVAMAKELGTAIAKAGWVTLSGGANEGVMDAVSKGARSENGLVIGILNSKDKAEASENLDIAVPTGMGNARNNINVLSSDVVVACGTLSIGTLSEVCLALSAGRPVILLGEETTLKQELQALKPEAVSLVETVEETISTIEKLS
ncbi:MAG: TIGR00725 family protein [Patescibacteria group bacterium]